MMGKGLFRAWACLLVASYAAFVIHGAWSSKYAWLQLPVAIIASLFALHFAVSAWRRA